MNKLILQRKAGVCPSCNKRNHPLAPDQPGSLCDKCIALIVDTSCMVVCNKCNEISAFIKPGQTPDGFEFKLGTVYRSNHCPKCEPLNSNINIIEMTEFLKRKGIGEKQ